MLPVATRVLQCVSISHCCSAFTNFVLIYFQVEEDKDKEKEKTPEKDEKKKRGTLGLNVHLPKFPTLKREKKPKSPKEKKDDEEPESPEAEKEGEEKDKKKKKRRTLSFTLPRVEFKRRQRRSSEGGESPEIEDGKEKEEEKKPEEKKEEGETVEAAAAVEVEAPKVEEGEEKDKEKDNEEEKDKEEEKKEEVEPSTSEEKGKKDKDRKVITITLPSFPSFKRSKRSPSKEKPKEGFEVKDDVVTEETKKPEEEDKDKSEEAAAAAPEDKKDKKKKKRRIPSFGKSKPKKSSQEEPEEEPAEREVSSPHKLQILKLPVPAIIVPRDVTVSSGWETDTSADPSQHNVSKDSGEVFTEGVTVVSLSPEQQKEPPSEPGSAEPTDQALQLSPGMDLGDLDKDWSVQSRVVKTVVVKKVIKQDGTKAEPEEISSVTRTEVTKQEGDDAPERDITLVKKEMVDGEEMVTEQHSKGEDPLAIATAMPIMANVPDDFELVERKVVKKSKLTRTIIHPDGREEVVVEEKEEVVDDEDRDKVMKEFEPDTKPGLAQIEPATTVTAYTVTTTTTTGDEGAEEEAEKEEGDTDFRLPGGQVEVVGGEVSAEIQHGDAAVIDVVDDDVAALARDVKEDSPIDLDTSQEHDSTDISTSDSGSKPPEPLEASGAQPDQPARGAGGGRGKGRRKKNRRR